jgi:chromate reductase, NAD(P)H dehydrogenase (quinone)
MNHRKKILGIPGSIRANSSNQVILQTIKDLYEHTLDVQLYSGMANLPHFDPDPNLSVLPPEVSAFHDLIQSSDGIIICSPEYIFSLPAIVKNALEWTVATTVFTEKPVSLIIASGLGEKAMGQLSLIMETLQAKTGDSTSLLLQGARAKINDRGKITDLKTLAAIDALMCSFIATLGQ